MAFSADSRFLCFTSNTETVHIFKIEGPIPKELRLEEEIALQFELVFCFTKEKVNEINT